MHVAGVVRVENCTFGPELNAIEAEPSSIIYSDDTTLRVVSIEGQPSIPVEPLADIPEPASDDEAPLFLTRNDKWFAELRNVRFPTCLPTTHPFLGEA